MPNMNSKQVKSMMKKMGINQTEIDCKQVIFVMDGKRLVFDNPSVLMVNMMGEKNYQVSGEAREEPLDSLPDISEEDISLVMEQAEASREEAQKAIEEAKGDLAEAILKLKGE